MTHPLLMSLFDEAERRPLSVSELTAQVRGALEGRFGSVWVEGEISNFRAHTSGHWYFTVKDGAAQLRAACFRAANARIRFRPADGLQVRVRGRLTMYEPRGECELIVEALDPVGAGALRVAFEQMRERLRAEGLFADELKRPLPLLPRRIGVVTSPDGAAIRDILHVVARRTRTVSVLFAPAKVQGEGAGREIAAAIELLNEHDRAARDEGRPDDRVDVIIVGRGGGSIEDLWAFNEEEVARAIRASQIPVISAVGHETDVTIADFVADVRAATPSAAAEIVAAREDELEEAIFELTRSVVRLTQLRLASERARTQRIAMSAAFDRVRAELRETQRQSEDLSRRLETRLRNSLEGARRRADAADCRLQPSSLAARVAENRGRFQALASRRDAAARLALEAARTRLAVAAAELDALSPLAVLQRGYALATQGDRLLRDAATVRAGDEIRLRLARGAALRCRVEETE